jgi:hypothetical protein
VVLKTIVCPATIVDAQPICGVTKAKDNGVLETCDRLTAGAGTCGLLVGAGRR